MSNYDVTGPMFIKRTLDNMKATQSNFLVTAIINFGFCIIVSAHEVYEDKIKKSEVPPLEYFGINPANIAICIDESNNTNKNFDIVIRHLRNAIAHWHFSFSGEPIKEIKFEDNFRGQVNFQMSIQYMDFKKFIQLLGEYLISIHEM